MTGTIEGGDEQTRLTEVHLHELWQEDDEGRCRGGGCDRHAWCRRRRRIDRVRGRWRRQPQPGTGGDLAAVQFWQYKDDASGAWGPATSLDSVRAAMNNAGVTLEGGGVTKAQAALDQARTECETGFQRRHPGEGNGDCRVVAVGAVPAVIGGNYIYNGSGVASPTGTGGWYDNWNTYVAPNTHKYAGTQNYLTSDVFSDDPSNSVDAIMRRNVEASSKPSIVVIVLDKYQPRRRPHIT